jgi:uncharacterized metal-binding protein YceD (DUF177 family)
VEKLSSYAIAFKGLKEGKHDFDFHIGPSFFELFENSLVDQADIVVKINLEKRSSYMSLELVLKGTVRLTCDRCLELYNQPVQHKAVLFVKFGEGNNEDEDEVIWLHPEDYQINVAQIIYEYSSLSIPLRHVHPSGKEGQSGCNPEMLKKIKEYRVSPAQEQDIRWNQLKNLLNNN